MNPLPTTSTLRPSNNPLKESDRLRADLDAIEGQARWLTHVSIPGNYRTKRAELEENIRLFQRAIQNLDQDHSTAKQQLDQLHAKHNSLSLQYFKALDTEAKRAKGLDENGRPLVSASSTAARVRKEKQTKKASETEIAVIRKHIAIMRQAGVEVPKELLEFVGEV